MEATTFTWQYHTVLSFTNVKLYQLDLCLNNDYKIVLYFIFTEVLPRFTRILVCILSPLSFNQLLLAGGREGFVLMEQWSHWESYQTEPQSYTANYLPFLGEKCKKPLEPGSAELDTKRSQDFLWYWLWAFWRVLAQVSGRRSTRERN